MDLHTLLGIRESEYENLAAIQRLRSRFSAYVELLGECAAGRGSMEDLTSAREALELRLRAEEARFLDWDDGQQVLHSEVFGLVERPGLYVNDGTLNVAIRRALAKFDYLVEEAQAEANAVNARIAAISPQHAHSAASEALFGAGQQYDAFRQLQSVMSRAKMSLRIVDGYVDERVLDMLKEKAPGVVVQILTKKQGVKASLRPAALAFTKQYGGLDIRTTDERHDRFIIVDDTEYYHVGASLKDAGGAAFMMSRIERPEMQETLRRIWDNAWASGEALQ
jgi:hypothetical protein